MPNRWAPDLFVKKSGSRAGLADPFGGIVRVVVVVGGGGESDQ
jgi:hypothetical protein